MLVVGSWRFAGMGWLTNGDAALAADAAARARARRLQSRRRQGRLTLSWFFGSVAFSRSLTALRPGWVVSRLERREITQ